MPCDSSVTMVTTLLGRMSETIIAPKKSHVQCDNLHGNKMEPHSDLGLSV